MSTVGKNNNNSSSNSNNNSSNNNEKLQKMRIPYHKGWLAIAKLKPLSLFISLLLMLKKALDNGKMVR